MGYRYEVQVDGKWYDNAVVFQTEDEANHAASNKLYSWTQCQDTRVFETDKPVNYRCDPETGAVIHIATEGAS